MKNVTKLFAAATLLLGSATTAFAQESENDLDYKPYPYMFIGLQGGVQTTFTNYDFGKLITPTVSVSFGSYFTPVVGARLHVNGWQNRGGFKSIGKEYDYNYINTNADVLLNLTNLFSKKNNHVFNVILLGGIGLNYAWDNDDLNGLLATQNLNAPLAWKDDRLSHNARVGIQFDVNVSKHWGVNLEIAANNLSDRYNSKSNNKDDWQATAQLGIAYKFGFKKNVKPAPVSVTPVADYTEQKRVETAVVSKPDPKPVVVKEEALKENIFYAIRESDPNAGNIINKVIEWGKKYPNKKISVSGYADKGTGNPTINKKYAQQRVDKVVALLKKGGIPESQIEAKAYGDTVQPFAENDQNRCVIIIGK